MPTDYDQVVAEICITSKALERAMKEVTDDPASLVSVRTTIARFKKGFRQIHDLTKLSPTQLERFLLAHSQFGTCGFQRLKVALHETAHSVVGLLMGGLPGPLRLAPEDAHVAEMGSIRISRPPTSPGAVDDTTWARRWSVSALAGMFGSLMLDADIEDAGGESDVPAAERTLYEVGLDVQKELVRQMAIAHEFVNKAEKPILHVARLLVRDGEVAPPAFLQEVQKSWTSEEFEALIKRREVVLPGA